MRKDYMRRLGILPTVVDLDVDLYDEVVFRELSGSFRPNHALSFRYFLSFFVKYVGK